MKRTTLGRLRSAIRESLDDHDVKELRGFRVGEDYRDSRGNVGRLVRIYATRLGGGRLRVMAKQQFDEHSIEQLFSVWEKDHFPA